MTDHQGLRYNLLGHTHLLSMSNQWVVNIGGIAANNYSTGVQVPVSVIIFGIGGGYLRFLYSTSTKEDETQQKVGERELFYETLQDLALLLLSPLLAIAVWLLLFQGGMTSIFTLAAVSFTVGLVTKEAVDALTKFARSRLPQSSSTKDEVSKDTKVKNESTLHPGYIKAIFY
jgi:hypothetical protein